MHPPSLRSTFLLGAHAEWGSRQAAETLLGSPWVVLCWVPGSPAAPSIGAHPLEGPEHSQGAFVQGCAIRQGWAGSVQAAG